MTEIKIAESVRDRRNIIRLVSAEVVVVDEKATGVNSRTGEPWATQSIHVKIDLGEGMGSNYMRLTMGSRILREMQTPVQVGDIIDVELDFGISQGPYFRNNIRVITLNKHAS